MEAEARAEAEEMVRQAEVKCRELESTLLREAEAASAERRTELQAHIEAEIRRAAHRYEDRRQEIIDTIVATVLGEDSTP